jgi:small subunit ribosomal protein S1
MPASQVDIHHVDDLEHFVGQKITAMVQEVDRRHKKVLLSRRAYLERQKQRQQRKTLAELEVGQEREGTVSNVTDFGAFVDLGGVDGLVHVTDLAYGHVGKPSDVVKKGDTVKVKVLKIDAEKQRIGLGIKQVQPDPWELAAPQLQPGEQVEGTVTKTANFGAFVQLDLGVEGLLPMSEISWRRINNAEQVVQPGQKIRVQVLEVDRKKQRLTLSLKQVAGDPWAGAGSKFERGQAVQGTVRTVTDFGAFVELEPGVEGLAHISELSDRRIGKVTDVLNVGDTKTFYIKDVKTDDRKLSLSLRDPAKFAKEQAAAGPRIKPRPKISKDKLKSGLGNTGAMGTGLGGLSLDDLK